MPDEIYEIIALAARYWFLLLMVLIAWRSYRWYARDRKKYKRRLKLLPDAGYVGELVVVRGDDVVRRGTYLPVSREGVLGYLRSNDVCLPAGGVANRHLWYTFDDTDGLRVEPFRGRMIVADGQELVGKKMQAYLAHGSSLQVGQATMKLRMFSGFEYAGAASARHADLEDAPGFDIPEELEDTPHSDRVRRMHEMAAWQTMLDEDDAEDPEFYPPDMSDEEYDDEADVYPPEDGDGPGSYALPDDASVFYPPVMDDEELPPADAADKSLYVDEDESERAKRVLWDKYLRGEKKP